MDVKEREISPFGEARMAKNDGLCHTESLSLLLCVPVIEELYTRINAVFFTRFLVEETPEKRFHLSL